MKEINLFSRDLNLILLAFISGSSRTVSSLWISRFEFVSDFDIRISDFLPYDVAQILPLRTRGICRLAAEWIGRRPGPLRGFGETKRKTINELNQASSEP